MSLTTSTHTHTITAGCPSPYRVCMLSVGPSPAPSKLLGSSTCLPGGALVCWIRHRPAETTRHGSLTTDNIPFLTLWALQWILMLFKITQLRKQCVSTAKAGWLMLFSEIIAVYSHNYSKHIKWGVLIFRRVVQYMRLLLHFRGLIWYSTCGYCYTSEA
jgi:hypothetical protein